MEQALPVFSGTSRYEIRAKLGSGGFGAVYRAYDREHKCEIALKTLTRLDPSALYRFKREFRALAGVTHENLVTLHDLVATDSESFLTMELVEGVTFLDWVRPGGRLDPDRLRDAARQLARGVEALHHASVLHRDLKPSNVLVARDGRVVLVDFGIVADLAERIDDRTDFGAVIGTPEYMAPEQGQGLPLTEAADWYAVGTMLFEAVAGRRPFRGALVSVLVDKTNAEAPLLSTFVPGVRPEIDALCAALLRREPAERGGVDEIVATFSELSTSSPSSERRRVAQVSLPRELSPSPPPAASAPRIDIAQTLDSSGGIPVARHPTPISTPSSEPDRRSTLAEEVRSSRSGAQTPNELPSGRRFAASAHATRRASRSGDRAGSLGGPFVGRRDALSTLASGLDAAWAGRGSTVVVRGRSGMGKSALVRTFLERIIDGSLADPSVGLEAAVDAAANVPLSQAVILAGRCYERELVPYKAFDSVVDALSRHLLGLLRAEADSLTPRDSAALVRVFPVMARVPSIADAARDAPDTSDPQQQRRRAFGALREIFGRLSAMRPVVIHIDDLQWGDADSAPLLAELSAEPEAPNLLLILGHRSEVDTPELRALVAAATKAPRRVQTIAVEPLGPHEARRLASSLLAAENAERAESSTLIEEIVTAAAGDPFVVGQLCRYVAASTLSTSGSQPGEALGDAAKLSDLLARRFSSLGERQRRVLDLVSVAGRPTSRDVVCRALDISSDASREAFASLRDAQLLRVSPVPGKTRFEPYHDRIREAVVSGLSADTKKALHRALADAMEAVGEVESEAMFVHLRGAGEVRRALDHAERAAADAVVTLAFDHAAALYEAAIEMLQGAGMRASKSAADERRAHTLRVARAHALVGAGRGAEAAKTFLQAVETAQAHERLELHRSAAEQWLYSGHMDEGIEVFRLVLDEVGLRLPGSYLTAIFTILWLRLRVVLRGTDVREVDVSKIPARDLTKIDICSSVAAGLGIVDRISGATFQHRQTLLALRSGDKRRIARALAFEGAFVSIYGTEKALAAAEAYFSRAKQLSESLDAVEVRATLLGTRGLALAMSAKWTAARAEFDAAVQLYRSTYIPSAQWESSTAKYYLFMMMSYQGDIREAEHHMASWQRAAVDTGDLYLATNLDIGEGTLVRLARGHVDDARERASAAIERWSNQTYNSQHYWGLVSQAYADLYEGRGAHAVRRIDAHWKNMVRTFMTQLKTSRTPIFYLRGAGAVMAAAAARDRSEYERTARYEIARLLRERFAWGDALAAVLSARLAALANNRDRQRAELLRASEQFSRAELPLAALFAKRRAALLAGGEADRAEAADAEKAIVSRGIVDVERMGAIYLAESP